MVYVNLKKLVGIIQGLTRPKESVHRRTQASEKRKTKHSARGGGLLTFVVAVTVT